MIQTYIILDKKTPLFKNLKKRGFTEKHRDTIFIWLTNKPNIGELIEITSTSTEDEGFGLFLTKRNKSIVLRITDLAQTHLHLKSGAKGIDILHLKCYEDSVDWL